MKQRATPSAAPTSAVATRMSASTSSSERTRREIPATRRSRSSASASAPADRTRSSASAPSAAIACASEISSGIQTRVAVVVASDEDTEDAPLADERDRGAALGADGLREPRADEGRHRDVVDGDRCEVVDGARDSGRLVAKVDDDLLPPTGLLALGECQHAARLVPPLVDRGERGELDADERLDVREQDPGDRLRVLSVCELVRDRGHPFELAVADGDELRGLARAQIARQDARALSPAGEEERRWRDRDHDREQREPEAPGERLALVEDAECEEPGGDRDRRERQRDREVRHERLSPLAPEVRCECHGHADVHRGQHHQRHRVEEHGLSFRTHWAL